MFEQVFDLQDTFEHAQKWVDELRQQVGGEIAIALAGNKSDMAESHITVTTSVSSQNNMFIGFFVTWSQYQSRGHSINHVVTVSITWSQYGKH